MQIYNVAKLAPFLLLCATAMAGCDEDEISAEIEESGGPTVVSEESQQKTSPKITETVSMRDPVEDCFTVQVPKGWFNKAYSARAYDIHREVVTCVSPNSDTVLFMGDPSIPQYWSPQAAHEVTRYMARVNPMVKIENYQSAEIYFPSYAKRKFGKLENFTITGVTQNEDVLNAMKAAFAKAGFNANDSNVVNVKFTYSDKGKQMSAILIGMTVNSGAFWITDVWGISTAGKAEDFIEPLMNMAKSKKTNPEWTAKQQALHEERMAQIRAHGEMMTAQHNRNMDWIQASAKRHQTRMQAIWAAGDASMKSYYERSASSDLQHQRFLNYINDENTVTSSSGKTFQVDNSYQRYFINKTNNSYIGGDIRFDLDEIRRRGLNPDDYEEVKIRP